MKAEHRHELKTNALADWLGNFPEWARENFLSVILVIATIVAAGGFYFWRGYTRNAQLEEQYRFTSLVNQISNRKMQILGAQGQATGGSSILFEPARELKAFASSTNDDNLAALALIKQAEALRTELHYRRESVPKQDLTAQIALAKESYINAVEKASNNQPLLAAARFGLGLCEEELGNFDAARLIYSQVADNAAFAGTVSVVQAKTRLETMADYKTNIVFGPKPKPKTISVKIRPDAAARPRGATNLGAVGPRVITNPGAATRPGVTMTPPVKEPNKPATKPPIKIVPVEPNVPAKAPEPKATAVIAPPAVEPNLPAVIAPPAVEPNLPAAKMPAAVVASPDPNTTPKTAEPNDTGM